MQTTHRFTALAAGVFIAISSANAQILFVSPQGTGAQQVGTLRRINADGTADQAFNVPFPDVIGPTWSRDGAQFALTAVDPQRPAQISRNVFALTPATGAVQQVTFFEDNVSQNGSYTYVYGLYKAFSPDRSLMAVFSVYRSGASNSSETGTPILEIYRTDGDFPAKELVHADPFRDGTHHGGEGVDWSPQNLLAAALKWDVPAQSGGPNGEGTAIILMDPVGGAIENGHFRQLTHPRADSGGNPFTGSAFVWSEHDYYPKFSPNGAGVAYVRSFQQVDSTHGGFPDPYIESIRIAGVNGGTDFELLRFQAGQYVTSLDWSPDGTEIVFDLGQQAFSNGYPLSYAQPDTVEMYVVNVSNAQVRKLRGAGGGQVGWAPAGIPTPGSTPTPTPPTTATPTPGSTPEPTATPTPASGNTGQPLNISTRMRVLAGDNVLIGGFIISGNQPKKVIVRGLGPSLPVEGALLDPTLELHQNSSTIATNDNWRETQQADIEASTVAPPNDFESAIVATLQPGSYTAILRGNNDSTGVGLVEVYDLEQDADAKLANISTRGFVDTGANVMIGGLIVGGGGGGNARVIIRALGPSLAASGVSGALQDPTVELRSGNGELVDSNDNWRSDHEAEIVATTVPPSNDAESAIVRTLTPGNYTAIVRGANDTTGVALVEVYGLQ